MVECQICYKKLQAITYSHLKIHNISFQEYIKIFPDAITIDDAIRKKQSDKKIGKAPWNKGIKCPQFAGDNNPSKRSEVRLKISESLKNSEKHKASVTSDQWKERQKECRKDRKLTEEHKANIGIGLKASEKYQKVIHSKEHSKKMSGKNSPTYGVTPSAASSHGKWCYYNSPLQGKIHLRSSYELAYAKYLDENNIPWLYEIKTFDLYDTTYTPDFFLPVTEQFIEIKGYMRPKAQDKINKFLNMYVCNFQILYKADLVKLGVEL